MVDSKEVTPSKGKGKLISDTSDIIKVKPEVFNPKPDVPNNNPDQSDSENALISSILKVSSVSDNDLKSKLILEMVKGIIEIYERVDEQKAWAMWKVAQSETMLGKEYSELKELKMAMMRREDTENKINDHSKESIAVKTAKEYVQIRAEILAGMSESEKELRKILKREKCKKKLADMENQTRALETQYEKELLRAERMEQELVQAKKEALEVEHVATADSKEVKPSKGKGKFISDTSDTMKENPEVFNPKSDIIELYEQLKALISNIDIDPKAKQIVDLVKGTSELYEKVTEQKAWALRKVDESEMSLKKHYSELQDLRTAKAKWGDMENKRDDSEKSHAIKMKEEFIHDKRCQFRAISDNIRRLESENDQIMADIQLHKMSASESEKKLREIRKKKKMCDKKLADMENQTSDLKKQYEKELQRAEQMEQESIEIEKEAKEVEIQWKQEIKEKDRLLALLTEETRLVRTQKARSKAYLSNLRRQVDTEYQVAEDERRRLEDELSLLRQPCSIDDLFTENLDFTDNYDEADLSSKPKSHLLCMVCMENVVSVLFLPCTHQVLCFPCYESMQSSGAQCLYCGVGIEQSIKVYGPSS